MTVEKYRGVIDPIFMTTEVPAGELRVARGVILSPCGHRALMGQISKQAKNTADWGMLEFLGGKQESGLTLVDTVKKECLEEAGVQVLVQENGVHVASQVLRNLPQSVHNGLTKHTFAFVGNLSDESQVPRRSPEHIWVGWVAVREIINDASKRIKFRADTYATLARLAAHTGVFPMVTVSDRLVLEATATTDVR